MEGNSKSIQILPKSVQESIKKIIDSEGYVSYRVSLAPINTGGANFLGELFAIDIKGSTTDGEKETNIFVKRMEHLAKVKLVSPSFLYQKESFFYNEVEQIFNCLQDEAQIPMDERFKLPKVYSETNPEVIYLENVSKKGFKTQNRLEALPLKYIEMAIKQIGKLHALSFVIEKKYPEFYNKSIKTITNQLHYDEDSKSSVQKNFAYVADVCDESVRPNIEKFMSVFFEKYDKIREDKTSTICSLSHGDLRSENILYRHHNGEPVEAIIIDYQFIDYGCPLRDLFYFLTLATDQDIRRNHLDNLKELYYETLSKFLMYFDIGVESVFPRNEFHRVFSEWFGYGLMMIMMFLPVVFAPATGIDYTAVSLSEAPLNFDNKSKDIIRKLIDDLVYLGYM